MPGAWGTSAVPDMFSEDKKTVLKSSCAWKFVLEGFGVLGTTYDHVNWTVGFALHATRKVKGGFVTLGTRKWSLSAALP